MKTTSAQSATRAFISLSPLCTNELRELDVYVRTAPTATPGQREHCFLLLSARRLPLSAASLQSLPFFFFFPLTYPVFRLLRMNAPERKTYVSGFICDTFLLPAAQIS